MRLHLVILVAAVAAMFTDSGLAIAQNQAVSDGCGANVGAVSNSSVAVTIDCGGPKRAQITVEYSRLFGAVEVPLLMTMFPQPKVIVDNTWGKDFRRFVTPKGGSDYAHIDLIEFLDKFPYKDARPLRTRMWEDVAGGDGPAKIAWRASAGLRNERMCYFVVPIVDTGLFNLTNYGQYREVGSTKFCDEQIRNFDSRIGFTFLIISNDSSEPITDVRFYFRQNYVRDRVVTEKASLRDLKDIPRSEFRNLPVTGDAVSLLAQKYGPASDAEAKVSRLLAEFYFAARLEPKQKLIALTDIYVANDNSLPGAYLYGIYMFDEIQFSYRGEAQILKVRPPALERAARVQVPYGWASQ